MLAVAADALACPCTHEELPAHEATAALPCVLAVGFGFAVVPPVGHRSPCAQGEHPNDPVLLGQRFHLFGEGGGVGSVGHGFAGRHVTDLRCGASRILNAHARSLRHGYVGA